MRTLSARPGVDVVALFESVESAGALAFPLDPWLPAAVSSGFELTGAALPELLPLFVVCEFPCDSLCANAPAAVNAAAARKVAVILRMPMVFPPSWRRRCASRDRVSIAGNKFEKCALAGFRSRFIG